MRVFGRLRLSGPALPEYCRPANLTFALLPVDRHYLKPIEENVV
jgi:hypothetical protein